MQDRRQFIAGLFAVGTAGLTGCQNSQVGFGGDFGRVIRPHGEPNQHGVPVVMPSDARSIVSDFRSRYGTSRKKRTLGAFFWFDGNIVSAAENESRR